MPPRQVPKREPPAKIAPERYLNRELSWLEFNARVLEEACSPTVPLMERVKFLSIVGTNMDEFFMVRVAGLKREVLGEVNTPGADGMTPAQQLRAIALRVRRLVRRQYWTFQNEIRPQLAAAGVRIAAAADLTDAERAFLDKWFDQMLFPVLTPMAVDAGHPFPVLVNNGLYVAASLTGAGPNLVPGMDLLLVQAPTVMPRFLALPTPAAEDGRPRERRFIPLEQIIVQYLSRLFRGYTIRAAHCFRVTRDSDIILYDEEISSLPDAIQAEIRRRRHGAAVRLEADQAMPATMRLRLTDALKLQREDVYPIPSLLHLGSLMELYELPGPERLKDEPLPPLSAPRRPTGRQTWFDVIAAGDVLLHHPYQGFEPVIELVQSAAEDPDVLAIKQTLYRTAKDSQIIRALIRAAENGKQVSVLMELKARFDEERNLEWARRLEQAGAHVIYGVVRLKTHCKALLIVRREPGGIRRYVHLATGNYNERTARMYTDIGLFTSRPEFGEDISALFNVITGYSQPPAWNVIAMSPTDMKRRILDLIEREAKLSTPEKPGRIVAKMNSLENEDAIDALYAASKAGVKIDLIIRGLCRLRPGVKGLSENIRVTAIIDRFLEHSRVFRFAGGGAEEFYLSSADWMQRNFQRRIEVLFPVFDPALREQLRAEQDAALADNVKAWELQTDGSYRRRAGRGTAFRSQLELYRRHKSAMDAAGREAAPVFEVQPAPAGMAGDSAS